MLEPSGDRGAHRLTKVAMFVAVATATFVLVLATAGLRWAHTYRQSSGEGLAFAWIAVGLVMASAGTTFSVGVLVWARARTSPRRGRLYALVATVLVALVLGAVAFTVHVESLGEHCFGHCG